MKAFAYLLIIALLVAAGFYLFTENENVLLSGFVGEDHDEHDDEDEELDIQPHGAGRFTVRALTPLPDFNSFFKTDFEIEDVETIGGFLLRQIGYLPERGESITLDNLVFKVMSADSRQVHLYQVIDNGGPAAERN